MTSLLAPRSRRCAGVLGPAGSLYDRPVGPRYAPWPGEAVRLDGGTDLFVRHAAGRAAGLPPAVLVHGLGGSSTNWTPLMDELTDVLDLWAPDLPGFGESPPARRHTVDAYEEVVEEYLERFGGRVHLVGNSMGGLVAVLVAARRPDLVASLTLVSPAMPGLRLPWAARRMAVLALPRLGERLLEKLNDVPAEDQIRRMAEVMLGDPELIDDEGFAAVVEERERRIGQGHANAVLLEALRSIVRYYAVPPRRSAWAAARRITRPTLVLLGRRDLLVGSSTAARWRKQVRARIVTLPAAGHVAMMEYPEVVASLIRNHVTSR